MSHSIQLILALILLCAILRGPLPVPAASFSVAPQSGHLPHRSFTDTSTGSPAGFAWYFGDEDYHQSQWVKQNGSAWYGRFGHASVALPDGSIVLMGGGGGYKNDVWRSTDQGVTWTAQNTSAGWTGREFHTSVALPDEHRVIGRYNGAYFMDVWRSEDQGATGLGNCQCTWPARAKHASSAP
jgi:hypothetical protein